MCAELTDDTIVIQNTNRKEVKGLDSWVHPLDRPEMKDYISNTLPKDVTDRLTKAIRPTLSINSSPSELEDSQGIQTRREQIPYERVSR